MITLRDLASPRKVDSIVGNRVTKRWNRSSPLPKKGDGHSRETWFGTYSPEERVQLVRNAILGNTPWDPLLRFEIAKVGKSGYRTIDVSTIRDQAILYLLQDELRPLVESQLSKTALAYRTGKTFHSVVTAVRQSVKSRSWVATMDIVDYFPSLRWGSLDALLDSLPIDDCVAERLRGLWRVAIVDRDSRVIRRDKGLPQGLVVSPLFANFALASFDRHVNHALSHLGCKVLRYSDDILVAAPSQRALEHALIVVRDRAQGRGLAVTEDCPVDITVEPAEWLGLLFTGRGVDVSASILSRKIEAIRLKDPMERDPAMRALLAHYRGILPRQRVLEVETTLGIGIGSAPPANPCPPLRYGKEMDVLRRLRCA